MMMRKELGVQSQQIELYNIYEWLSTTYILVCCCWHLFWYSSCLSVREKEREKRVRVFVLGVWVVSTCAWACRLALPACEPSADCAFIYLFYIFVLCVSSQGKEEDEKKKTFYTIGRFLHLLVRVRQTGKHLEKELETASRIFRFIVVLHLFLALNLIGSDRKRVKMLTNNNHIQGRKETKEMRTSSAGEMRSTREGDGATTSIMNL